MSAARESFIRMPFFRSFQPGRSILALAFAVLFSSGAALCAPRLTAQSADSRPLLAAALAHGPADFPDAPSALPDRTENDSVVTFDNTSMPASTSASFSSSASFTDDSMPLHAEAPSALNAVNYFPQASQADPGRPSPAQQPKRILGLMPNYRTVSAGATPPPPTFKQGFHTATRQALDYSSFIFLGLTTASAYWEGSHPSLDTWNGGNAPFYAYLWRGFLDKTDQTYQSAWILPTLFREDTRYYAMGTGSKWRRLGYAMSRVAVARTYSGHNTPNFAGLGGKVGAQAVSTTYYPPATEDFGVLATKFAYSCARDMGFTVFREFYPDIAVHVLHRNP